MDLDLPQTPPALEVNSTTEEQEVVSRDVPSAYRTPSVLGKRQRSSTDSETDQSQSIGTAEDDVQPLKSTTTKRRKEDRENRDKPSKLALSSKSTELMSGQS